jgi:hypothetical protein
MMITKRGKCNVCEAPSTESREFIGTVDMFSPQIKQSITTEISDEIVAWREKPILCQEHR